MGECLSKRWSISSWAIKGPFAIELQRPDDNVGQKLMENEKDTLQVRPPRVFTRMAEHLEANGEAAVISSGVSV